MLWKDKVSDVLAMMNGASIYNTSRTTTPGAGSKYGLGLVILNATQDWLCMVKPWRDLRVDAQLVLDSDRKVTMPADYGCCMFVYTDPSNIGKPMYFYSLNDNDVARRYTEEATQDANNVRTLKFCFPPTVFLPANPHVVYSKVLRNYVDADIDNASMLSFFPLNTMFAVSKLLFQDFYGVPANQDPNWIQNRLAQELRMLEAYAYNNNVALDMAVKDRFGNPVFIQGTSLDGSKPRLNRPSPFLPSTLFSGGSI
jgi:hypothetical protein